MNLNPAEISELIKSRIEGLGLQGGPSCACALSVLCGE